MIKFAAHKPDGTRIVGIGITKELFHKLLQGEVATIDLRKLGLPGGELMLVGGDTELSITRNFQYLIGKNTGVHIDPSAIKKG